MVRQIFILILTCLVFLITACDSQIAEDEKTDSSKTIVQPKKSDYQLAYDFLYKLKKEKADTIVFYKRTCIDCCDFFTIFWSAKGQKYLTKIHPDHEDPRVIPLTSGKIFEILYKNYIELKSTSIKDNLHRNKDGKSILIIMDHYCYTQMSIYTNQDSIITDRMKDHDFDEYTDYGIIPINTKEKRQTNDNYKENVNSKWNLWLTAIEAEIAKMPETISGEEEIVRIRKRLPSVDRSLIDSVLQDK